MHDELVTEIMALPREIAIEAARFLAADVTGGVSDEQGETAGAWAGKKPFTHVGDVETLARLVLIAVHWAMPKSARALTSPSPAPDDKI